MDKEIEKIIDMKIKAIFNNRIDQNRKLLQKMIDDSLESFKRKNLSFRSKMSIDTPKGAYEVANSRSVTTGTTFLPVSGGTMNDGANIAVGSTTGTKIGTATNQKLGFFNASPVAQQSVTGSRGGNVALASLITKIASLGFIVDNTTA